MAIILKINEKIKIRRQTKYQTEMTYTIIFRGQNELINTLLLLILSLLYYPVLTRGNIRESLPFPFPVL
jgi:hypothetical protein